MVVYIDEVFLLNFLTDYLVLEGTAHVAGSPFLRRRLLVGGLIGGAYAAGCFLPGFGFLTLLPWKGGVALLMVLTAFGWAQPFLKHLLVFTGLSCALCGGVLAVSLLGEQQLTLKHGVLMTGLDLRAFLLAAAVCYVGLSVGFRHFAQHTALEKELLPVTVAISDKEYRLTAFLDTGNDLRDPLTGREVLVAEATALSAALPNWNEWNELPPTVQFQRLEQLGWGARVRLLPFCTIGGNGMLLAVKSDYVKIGTQKNKGMLVALSPHPVSDGGGYSALIGGKGNFA